MMPQILVLHPLVQSLNPDTQSFWNILVPFHNVRDVCNWGCEKKQERKTCFLGPVQEQFVAYVVTKIHFWINYKTRM